jgi:hypothetical protein
MLPPFLPASRKVTRAVPIRYGQKAKGRASPDANERAPLRQPLRIGAGKATLKVLGFRKEKTGRC